MTLLPLKGDRLWRRSLGVPPHCPVTAFYPWLCCRGQHARADGCLRPT
uniref:Uncharacterized protein n=1 Tax=Anguilla anguilla TaxID=7936 RepID=A0A0E9QJ27_ANGAN